MLSLVNVAEAVSDAVQPLLNAFAFRVVVEVSVNEPVYSVDDVLGVLPSVV